MVKFIKKNITYVLVGIIVLLSIVIGICIFLLISRSFDSGNKNITCVDSKGETNQKITYDKTGKIINYQYISFVKYDDDAYEAMKKVEPIGGVKYKFNDKTKTVTQIYEPTVTKDENGNEVSTWYVTYVKSLVDLGYTCK